MSPSIAALDASTELTAPAQQKRARRLYRLNALDLLLSRRPMPEAPRAAQRAELLEALWANAPFERQAAEPVPVLTAEEATFDAFIAASRGYRRPVVIRGFGREVAAVKRWSADYLAERLGDAPCTVVEMDEAALTRPHESKRTLLSMPFTEFVERMHHERLYLHNSTEFVQQCPELLDEVEIDRVGRAFTTPGSDWDELFASNLFVGTEQVFSNIHCAPGGNFFLQIAGAKTWTLVDPALSPYLGPVLSRPFNHCLSVYGSYRMQGEDCPIYRLPRMTVTLEPGDLLYNPPWWWHEVSNHGATIGCALRHVPRPFDASPTWRNHRLFSALSVYPQLWGYSALSYLRHRMGVAAAPMRARLNPRLARELNKARGR